MSKKIMAWAVIALAIATIATSCKPRSAPAEVKLALIAPFEGEGRPLGYQTLCGVKLAIKEHGYRITDKGPSISLIALNDDNIPEKAQEQLRAAEADKAVLAVLGPWRRGTANAVVSASPKVAVLIPAPVNPLADHTHRFFADDASLREAISSATGGKCAEVLSSEAGYLNTIPRCDDSHMLVVDGDSPDIVREACRRMKSGENFLIAGPDFARPWILPLLPSGASVRWVTSWEVPPKGFSEEYRSLCNSNPSHASFASYESANLALRAIERAYENHRLDRAGVDEEISKLMTEMRFPVTAYNLER